MSGLNESSEETAFQCLSFLRGSRRLIVFIVAIALLLDNMLLTCVVPIIPDFLYQLNHQKLQTNEPRRDRSESIPKGTEAYEFTTPVSNDDDDDDGKPHFVGHNLPKKETMANLAAPGFTLVPNEHFWEFTDTNKPTQNSSSTVRNLEHDEVLKKQRHKDLVSESFEIGILFASKPLFQVLTNPFIGPLSNRIGYTIPMFTGFAILFATTLLFALGNNYTMLFVARSLQGIGSSCSSTAGMGMLASIYPDDDERGKAMAIALGGLAFGVLIGPVFGGTMYEFVGRASPFLVIAVLALLDGFLQLTVLQPRVQKQSVEGSSIMQLLKDPYILVAAGAICFSNLGISVLEPSLPLWMMDTMNATKWQQGVAFLPPSISYLIGTNVFGPLGHKIGRWLSGMIGLIIIGVCLLCVPLAKSVDQLIPANAGIGFAIGMVDSSMMPLLGYLVDIRHTSVYGSIYAIADSSFCIGFIIGPLFSASIVKRLGFEGLVYVVAFISFLYAPLMIVLRKPPEKEGPALGLSSSIKYTSYTDEDKFQDKEALKKLKDENASDQSCY